MTRWAKPPCDMAEDYPSSARHTEALSVDPAIQLALAIERGDAGPAPSGALVRHETLWGAPRECPPAAIEANGNCTIDGL